MPNKDYQEGGEGSASLPEKVKGKVESGAAFKPFTNPDGGVDQEKSDINGTGVAHPEDSQKKLK